MPAAVPDLPPAVLAALTGVFRAYPEIEEVILFGSRATGRATPRSDIDLAARGLPDERRLGRLALDLDDLDIPQICDLKAYEQVCRSPLRAHIDAAGIVIYRKSRQNAC